MAKKTTVVVFFVCVLAVAAAVFIPQSASGKPIPAVESATAVYTVRSEKVVQQNLISYIQTNGDVEAASSIEVYPDMGGKLVRTSVALGSQVRKGQVIAEVDPSTPGVPYAISPVRAPLSGAITSVPLQPGTTVTVNTPIAVIGSIDDIQISANIPERYASLLKPGLKADITLEAYPGIIFPATVTRVSPVVDALSRTKEIQLIFEQSDDRINAGMFAKIKLYTTETDNVLTIPEACIVTSFGNKSVFVLSGDSTVSQREVTTGMSVDGIVEVKTGLNLDDRVIVEGMQLLTDGAVVRDISQNSSSVSNGGAV